VKQSALASKDCPMSESTTATFRDTLRNQRARTATKVLFPVSGSPITMTLDRSGRMESSLLKASPSSIKTSNPQNRGSTDAFPVTSGGVQPVTGRVRPEYASGRWLLPSPQGTVFAAMEAAISSL